MSELTVFLTSYNTGLQGSKAHEQDLSSWLIPVLHSAGEQVKPDIYAIAVQELLPLHLALAGLSQPVLMALTNRIESVLSAHATSLSTSRTPETFTLISRVCHVGTALWVFARDSTTQGRIGKALQSSVGLWHFGMGNKAAVGCRVPIMRGKESGWETLTFVSAHLDAHDHNVQRRNEQYNTILSSLVFAPGDALQHRAQPFQTSHLFLMGDLNYRLERLPTKNNIAYYPQENKEGNLLDIERERADMIELETLQQQQRAGKAFGGLREGDLTRFAPTYKRIVGEVNGYSTKRIPGWTDRILFASYNDPAPGQPNHGSSTQILHFNSTPELTISDHKPVHAVLQLPPPRHESASLMMAPVLPPPPPPSRPRPAARDAEELRTRLLVGMLLDRLIGWPWTILVLLGFGNDKAGMGVGAFLGMVWGIWWSGMFSG